MAPPREQFRHVYWIGGASRAGKSTIANRIASERGWQLYSTDASMAEHARRSNPEEHPYLAKWLAMDMDERWVRRSPQVMFDTFPWFCGECFEMILEDILALPKDPPILVEGFRLLPGPIKPLQWPGQAVWLIPSARFREEILVKTEGAGWEFLSKTSDWRRAYENLFDRDALFSQWLWGETAERMLHGISVDFGRELEDIYEIVTYYFDR